MTEVPYRRQPLTFPVHYEHGPDSFRQPSVPGGVLREFEWNESRVFPGTSRRYSVYAPAQYDARTAAGLMVFQDAKWYLEREPQR